ncbi:MAG: KilA-N domain-containing protein [Brachymonas sp.]|nr:KilA-N domain-containing protein [Brachymonas sp.]
MATSLVPFGTETIRQFDGLFSLNDLHRMSGGEKRHQPSDFLRLTQTQELIEEINSGDSRNSITENLAVKTIRGGRGGTYVVKELAIAYAAWISAPFHLQVLRVFLGHVESQQPELPLTPPTSLLDSKAMEAARAALSKWVHDYHDGKATMPTVPVEVLQGVVAESLMDWSFVVCLITRIAGRRFGQWAEVLPSSTRIKAALKACWVSGYRCAGWARRCRYFPAAPMCI